jgi:predicted transcriptional regulator of viral defense system
MMQTHNVGSCEHFPTLCIIDVAMSRRNEKQILSLIKKLGVVRPMDLQDRGYPRGTLYRLLQEGLVMRQARGLYVAIDHAFTAEHTLAETAKRVPNGVICLLTALRFHGLTTQMPPEVWIALPEKARRPRLEYPRLRVARFSGAALTEGLETHSIEGVAVRIYSAAKTVADCFKYRNKVGIDVAVEALKDYSRMHRGGTDELVRFARICRVTRVMQPYLDAIA